MATLPEYAALSAIVYNDVRDNTNKINNLPSGWIEILSDDGDPGFTAGAYRNANEIVIAFKGSDAVGLTANAAADWLAANAPAFAGFGSPQLIYAVMFYQAVKIANPTANITFTGHSLGGGLASLLAVYFDRPATTFDQAPFLLTAINPVVTAAIAAALASEGIFDSSFASFAINPLATVLRQSNVKDYYVPGELVSYLRYAATGIYGSDTPIPIGGGDSVAGSNLHSMNLAAALLIQDQFRADTVTLPNLLEQIFDVELYASSGASNKRDFLTSLLNSILQPSVGNNSLLEKFSFDLAPLKAGFVLKNDAINKALLSIAIEHYYVMESGFTQKLFTAQTNGVSFKFSDVDLAESAQLGRKRFFDAVTKIDLTYYDKRSTLEAIDQWVVNSDTGGLNYSGSTTAVGILGGDQGDNIQGGSGKDFLIGNGGSDAIKGGDGDDILDGSTSGYGFVDKTGNDQLEGEAGNDTYYADGGDWVNDSDATGKIYARKNYLGQDIELTTGRRKKGEQYFKAENGIQYLEELDGTIWAYTPTGKIKINGIYHAPVELPNGTILSGQPGLGIELITTTDSPPGIPFSPVGTGTNAAQQFIPAGDPFTMDLDGNGLQTVGTNAGVLFDLNGDGIKTGTGWVGPGDGFLALDQNGNGVIDDGRELFGDATLKSNGQTAVDGFDALSDLDANHDGKVDANDPQFANLRVWVDADTDGLTDSGELKTLSQLGIAGFNTAKTSHHQILPNGNQVADLGTYFRVDGSLGETGTAYESGDINLTQDTFHREFTDTIPLANDVKTLPDMQGSGLLAKNRRLAKRASNDAVMRWVA